MTIPTYEPADVASRIRRKRHGLPAHFFCACNSAFAAAVLSSKLNRLGFTVTVSEDHELEAMGPQPSTVGGDWTVPS